MLQRFAVMEAHYVRNNSSEEALAIRFPVKLTVNLGSGGPLVWTNYQLSTVQLPEVEQYINDE